MKGIERHGSVYQYRPSISKSIGKKFGYVTQAYYTWHKRKKIKHLIYTKIKLKLSI